MEIYLDANATTPVLAQARVAAMQAMAEEFGNPSSIHSTGLKARAMMDAVRQRARHLLDAGAGKLLFVSGATEGIQTAVLSALSALRERRENGEATGSLLLYGATEHKAVPETLKHWNQLLGLKLQVQAIPVDRDGRHDLAWLRQHAADAGMVCVMAANNETGVISDLAGIEAVLNDSGSRALWMVDGVQALGKLPLHLSQTRIDYAPFSGHKLYAPKGIGLLYVREGAPFTRLLAGGGQEGSLRSGTENMSGIAALGAVLAALDDGRSFRSHAELEGFRFRLAEALQAAFPGVVFNASLALSLPTTLNFSVPGLSSKLLLDMFDAADVRVSGGSACSAAKALPSFVLQAMGLPEWQTASAVRMSFGPAVDDAFITEAVARIHACGQAMRRTCLSGADDEPLAGDGVVQLNYGGACTWLLADQASQSCVVIDPQPELAERIEQYLRCQGYRVLAVLETSQASAWPQQSTSLTLADGQVVQALQLGEQWLARLPMDHAQAYLLGQARGGHLAAADVTLAFCGDALMPDLIGSPDPMREQQLQRLAAVIGPHTLICPAHDFDNRLATTLAAERLPPGRAAGVELNAAQLADFLLHHPETLVVDVREPYEQLLSQTPRLSDWALQAMPLSRLVNGLQTWLTEPQRPLVFFCRSGNRSGQAVQCLRRLGHANSYSLAGGLALWERHEAFAHSI
ncbi:MAG: aminotransferase class V-fold PLP-dependent enzyme [Burkholderiaceae bacterium]|nr:aminotransferase class V-fold PLP-dependent enzyme [Burkholderiaceae bacterium]